jgi:hypothetical protein
MFGWLNFWFRLTVALLMSRRHFLLENAALRHQLLVLSRKTKRPRFHPVDRVLWVCLSAVWNQWTQAMRLVRPETVLHWHRQAFRLFWRWKSRAKKTGRKSLAPATIQLIRQMCRANPLWGAPRIHGELLKLGITVAQRTVAKYLGRRGRDGRSQNWTTFLRNHFGQMVSVDFLTVPTVSFQVLYVFVVLSHARRQILHFNVTASPSARWIGQQLREAFPFTSHRNISYEIATAFTAWNSSTWSKLWALRNCGLRLVRPGSRPMWNASLVRYAGSVWTT